MSSKYSVSRPTLATKTSSPALRVVRKPLTIDTTQDTKESASVFDSIHPQTVRGTPLLDPSAAAKGVVRGKSQTPRNAVVGGGVKRPHGGTLSLTSPSSPVPSRTSQVRPTHHTSVSDLRAGTSTPKTASRPGTQRAVITTLTQRKSPPLIGSPRASAQRSPNTPLAKPTNTTRLSQSQSQGALKTLVTQVSSPSSQSQSTRKTQLSPDQIRERSERIYREHLFQTFQAMKLLRTLPMVDTAQLRSKRVVLEKRRGYANRKTIVFDLDETLVHCCESPTQSPPDVILPITFPTGEVVNAGLNIRPYAKEVLAEANRYFEVIIFTASHRCYADVVLDYLDPGGELIHHRLYRDNCVVVEGMFIKDLRILANRRLQEVIIVDNSAYSFGFQLDNGIPIISWQDDPYDKELFNLIDYMKILAGAEDIRAVNRDTFHLNTFYEDYIEEFLSTDERRP